MSEIRNNPPNSIYSKEQKKLYETLFDDITQNGTLLSYQDRHALAELAITLDEMETCRRNIEENGILLEVQGDRNQITKKNPAVDVLLKLQVHVKALFKEFSMTPNARGKTTQGPESGAQNDEFDKV